MARRGGVLAALAGGEGASRRSSWRAGTAPGARSTGSGRPPQRPRTASRPSRASSTPGCCPAWARSPGDGPRRSRHAAPGRLDRVRAGRLPRRPPWRMGRSCMLARPGRYTLDGREGWPRCGQARRGAGDRGGEHLAGPDAAGPADDALRNAELRAGRPGRLDHLGRRGRAQAGPWFFGVTAPGRRRASWGRRSTAVPRMAASSSR